MAKVRSSNPLVGVLIAEEATWGTPPGTWTLGSNCYQVPIIGCDIKATDEILPDSGEFTPLGAAQKAVRGRRTAQGSITFEPTYSDYWMWILFGQGFGSEDYIADYTHEDVSKTDVSAHVFTIAGVTPKGLSMLIYKGGDTASTSYAEEYNGLVCTSWTWTHPVNSRPTVTMNFVGLAGADPSDTVDNLDIQTLAGATSTYRVLAGDLDVSRANSSIFFGASTMANLNITSFTINGDRSVGASENEFLQNILTVSKPGQNANRNISIDIEGVLEIDYAATDKPWKEFNDDTLGRAVIDYCSSQTIITSPENNYYQIAFDFPSINWTEVIADLSQTGEIPFRASGRALSGAQSGLDGPFDAFDGGGGSTETYPASGACDLRVRMQCKGLDDDGDAAWTLLGVST